MYTSHKLRHFRGFRGFKKKKKSFLEQTCWFFSPSNSFVSVRLVKSCKKKKKVGRLGLNLAVTSADEHPVDDRCVFSRCHRVCFSLSWSGSGAASWRTGVCVVVMQLEVNVDLHRVTDECFSLSLESM